MRIENIPLSAIAIDIPGWDRYVFTYPLAAGKLPAAIQAAGLQQPVLLAAQDHLHHVVLGVKRVLACRELGRREIPALVRRSDTVENLLLIGLQEKTSTAPLNPMEKARALARFAEIWKNDYDALRERICPLIELPPTAESMENYLFFNRMPELVQTKLAGGELSPAHASLLAPLRHDEIEPVARALFTACQPTLQEAREMVENMLSLCAREGLRPRELLANPELEMILQDGALNPRERTARVRQWLHGQRFPRLAAAERRFHELVAPIENRAGVTIHPPRGFEGMICELRLQCSKEGDIEKAAAGLQQSLSAQTWKEIFELLRTGQS